MDQFQLITQLMYKYELVEGERILEWIKRSEEDLKDANQKKNGDDDQEIAKQAFDFSDDGFILVFMSLVQVALFTKRPKVLFEKKSDDDDKKESQFSNRDDRHHSESSEG